ncbi:MAG: helix-turn-helix transcriptional regulator [Gammaproteobacteria bacterium]|nr:helix-turn-helix transcriptional regulator [Gammaproteobacteria bacterium]
MAHEYDLEGLPARLQRLRQKRGLTQMEVADAMGVAQPHISHWESGRSYPKLGDAARLCKLYGITIDELCGRIDR